MSQLCIGCGICAAVCPHKLIKINYSANFGHYLPSVSQAKCHIACGICTRVCPFYAHNIRSKSLSFDLYSTTKQIRYDDVLGYYLNTYVGYSPRHRLQSSSGGLLSWTLEALFNSNTIDAAICVGPDPLSPTLFSYKVCNTLNEILSCSGSCYQPIEISPALSHLLAQDQRYAVVAVPCFARGLRLAMHMNPTLKSRIVFILGLVCGQMKARTFVEYLSLKYSKRTSPSRITFRKKRLDRSATDFAYEFIYSDDLLLEIGWSEAIDRPWNERWFTLEACDFCSDVFAECADATYMDAWLPKYSQDPAGHSLLIIRNPSLSCLFSKQESSRDLHIEPIEVNNIKQSQSQLIQQKRIFSKLHAAIQKHSKIDLLKIYIHTCKFRLDYYILFVLKRNIRVLTNKFDTNMNIDCLERKIRSLSKLIQILNFLLKYASRFRSLIRG